MNRTIISLAIISTNWEQKRKDYIENFVPLIGAIINKKKYKEIDLPTLKKDFTEAILLKVLLICKDFKK